MRLTISRYLRKANKAITILGFSIVAGGGLVWGFLALDVCLLPIQLPNDDPGSRSRVFPHREGILLSTAKGIYEQSQSGYFDKPVVGRLGGRKYADATHLFETRDQDSVFILTASESTPYSFTTSTGSLEPVRAADQCTVSDGESDRGYSKKESPIFLFHGANGVLCILRGSRLEVISGWPNDDTLSGAAETKRGVFLWGVRGAYLLDENNHVGKIAGISDGRAILGFYETSLDHGLGGVFVVTANGLFAYSEAGVLIGVPVSVPGDEPGRIHGMHEMGGALYTMASKGVFRLDEAGKLERLKESGTGGVIRTTETTKGVFVIYSDGRIYRLTDSGEEPWVSPVEKDAKPSEWDIKNTTVGPLLAKDRALYRFSEMNSWVLVPSGDLGRDAEIIPVIEKVAVGAPVFVRAENGVFEWIDGPFDVFWKLIKSPFDVKKIAKDAWNYMVIFWKEVGAIVASLLLILCVFVHYSLHKPRWVRYYILGLFWPSRIHNQIFISYRQDDAGQQAVTIYNELRHRFGRDLIFIDVEKLKEGAEFPAPLRKAVEQCSGLLAIIGPNWLDAKYDNGSRRLDDPRDFVRQEIELALDHGKVVFPIVRSKAEMPKRDRLPESLGKLADWQAVPLLVLSEKNLEELVQLLFATILNLPPPKGS